MSDYGEVNPGVLPAVRGFFRKSDFRTDVHGARVFESKRPPSVLFRFVIESYKITVKIRLGKLLFGKFKWKYEKHNIINVIL